MGQISINGISGGSVPYTIKVYQVGNNTPIFTDTTNTNTYTGTFSHTNGQSYYVVVEKASCSSFTSGNTALNCSSCQLNVSNLVYDCYSSTFYTLTFNISGGSGDYVYSKNSGLTWTPVDDNTFTDTISSGTSSILINNSDLTCNTTVLLNPSINSCELCFELDYTINSVTCVSGDTERKRLIMEISNNTTLGCGDGDYEYSNNNGATWQTVTSSFNEIYSGFAGNTIKLRYSLYPNKITTINVPAFTPPACNEGFYYTTNNCSCVFGGGNIIQGDWCGSSPRNFQSIPSSPSTFVSTITNPTDGNPNTNYNIPIYIAFYSPNPNMKLVLSKTGGTFLNGTTTYDTGFIGGVYMFKHILGEGQTIGCTIRSQSGGINCASVVTICGNSVGSDIYSWSTSCSGLPNNQASIYYNESIII